MKKIRAWLFFSLLLLAGLPAQAVDYTFPGALPIGCVDNGGGSYTCGTVTLGAGDTVTLAAPKPVTITFNGAFGTGADAFINAGGNISDLTLVVDGAVSLGAGSILNANLQTLKDGSVTIAAGSWIGGNVRTDKGFVAIGIGATPPAPQQTGAGGNVSTDIGYVSMGQYSVVNGSITTQNNGYVALGADTKVGGSISTFGIGYVSLGARAKVDGSVSTLGIGYVTLGADAQVSGSITVSGITGDDYVTTGERAVIGCGISTAGSYIALGSGTQVGGNISTKIGYISVAALSTVGGQISMNDPTPSYITIGGLSKVYAVCCNGTDASCVSDGSGITPGPAVCVVPSGSTGGQCSAPASNLVADFQCLETGASYNNLASNASLRNPLFTKLAGAAFAFDVVALKTDGTVETNYVATGDTAKSVTLELVDGAGSTACASRSPIAPAAQLISFTATDAGRKIASLTLNQAYPNLRCRVTDANQRPSVVACSSDNFAVRPTSATLLTAAAAPAPSALATPAIKAGAPFSLLATTSPSYTGTLTLDTSKLTTQTTTQDAIKANGGVVGLLTPALLIANAGAVTASYSEVGYLYLASGAFRDDSFTAIDSGAGDCITAAVDSANYLSDTLVGSTGKYGCSIGNKISVSLGRFYPDHFAVTPPVFTPGCGTAGDSKAFTYMGQSFNLSAMVEAQSLGNAKTQNFSGVFAKATVTPEMENANNGTAIDTIRLTGQVSPLWTSGSYAFVANGFGRGTAPDGPFDKLNIGLQVTSTETLQAGAALPALINRNMAAANTSCTPDSTGQSDGTCTATRIATEAKMRYGRLKLSNAYGSEKQDLKLPVTLQYWTALGWQTNTLDACSMAKLNSDNLGNRHFAFKFSPLTVKNTLTHCDTVLQPIVSTASALTLSKPTSAHVGWADISLNLSAASGTQCSAPGGSGPAATAVNMPWLQYGSTDPKARATFGVFKSPLIYRRENY